MAQSAFSDEEFLEYKINHYSKGACCLLGEEDSKNNLYKIKIGYVEEHLSSTYNLKRRDLRLIAKRLIPGRTGIKIARYLAYANKEYSKMHSPKEFFSALHLGQPHTYVILKDRLIFTETTTMNKQQRNKDRLSKHYFISNLQNRVHYAGEFTVYKNSANDEVFLVFDNGSGTYQPDKEKLPNLRNLLKKNFRKLYKEMPENKVRIVVKEFSQKVDEKKLFAHERYPFVEASTDQPPKT